MEAEEGPLWSSVKGQLYKSEVSHMKRLVGEPLIQQNQLMWNELSSLRSIHADFQERNDELQSSSRLFKTLQGSQHRDMLKRQAQIMVDDLRSQAASSGHILEDMVPELKDPRIVQFLSKDGSNSINSARRKTDSRPFTPPITPSTRPSSSSGCSTIPDPSTLSAPMPLGSKLGIEEINVVAAGIREALEAEQAQLLAAIGEQFELIEAEDARRAESVAGGRRGEPSTAELQAFLRKLQDLTVNPTLRTLSLAGPAAEPGSPPEPHAIRGGASARRLQALIAERRRASKCGPLGAVPETTSEQGATAAAGDQQSAKKPAQSFDPFFDDPFA
jgi:hypothetical protein